MIPAAADHVLGDPDSPYLHTDEAARYFRFDRKPNGDARTPVETMRMFREWAKRARIQPKHRGATLLWDKRVLAAAIEQKAKRHASTVTPLTLAPKGHTR